MFYVSIWKNGLKISTISIKSGNYQHSAVWCEAAVTSLINSHFSQASHSSVDGEETFRNNHADSLSVIKTFKSVGDGNRKK